VASALPALDGSLSVDSISLGWLSPVELRGIAVKDRAGTEVARADRAVTGKTLFSLLLDSRAVGTVSVEKPALDLVCTGPTTNVEDVLKKYIEGESSGKPRPHVTLHLVDGSVTVRSATKSVTATFPAVNG